MISIAVPELELGILTISPDTYFALPDGAVVTALVWAVVFVVLELFVHPVMRTQEIRSNTRLETRRFFLFIVLNEQGDYFKKSFYSYLLFHYHSAGPDSWFARVVPGGKRENPGKNSKKKPGMIILPSFQAV
jgi:hypothetical protein